jgi:predicted Zn-dependent protease with MMP-like domain
VSPDAFRRHVAKAIDDIPLEFQDKMGNLEIIVEDFADRETLESVDLESPWDLLGLYVGVPFTQRSFFAVETLPERIYLYRRPILREAGSLDRVTFVIRDVLIHELGHHFGFDDDQLDEMARRSR